MHTCIEFPAREKHLSLSITYQPQRKAFYNIFILCRHKISGYLVKTTKYLFFTLILNPAASAQNLSWIDYSDRNDVGKTFDIDGTDISGQPLPSESLTFPDPVTDLEITALTTSRHNNSKISAAAINRV